MEINNYIIALALLNRHDPTISIQYSFSVNDMVIVYAGFQVFTIDVINHTVTTQN
jgi:hypothetical protein